MKISTKAREFGFTVNIWVPVIQPKPCSNLIQKFKDELENVSASKAFEDLCRKYSGEEKTVLKRLSGQNVRQYVPKPPSTDEEHGLFQMMWKAGSGEV